MLQLQRSIGNRAVGLLLAPPRGKEAPPAPAGAVQRRVASVSEAKRTTREEPIFESRVHRGNVYTMERKMSGDDAFSAIDAYTRAIRPVGNDASEFKYLDRQVPTWWLSMSRAKEWEQHPMVELAQVQTDLALDYAMMKQTFFDVPKSKAISWLAMVHSQRDQLRKNPHTALVDPFLVEMTLTGPQAESPPWVITTQFADSATGYITRVVAGDKDVTGSITGRGDFRAERTKAARPDEFLFSSTHEPGSTTFGDRIKTLGNWERGDQKGTHARAFDAIAWMAAEGARFEPVRELGPAASPKTPLYVELPLDTARWVSLHWLMQHWGEHFHLRYGITAEEVAKVVAENGTLIPQTLLGRRYNLTKKSIEQ